MVFSNEPMDVMDIIQLLLPILTFAMGYFLTGIEHKRERKSNILREKFEKLYHPFYLLVNELGTDTGDGFAFSVKDSSSLKRFFEHFTTNVYLASSEGQALFWEARVLFYSCLAEGDNLCKAKEEQLDQAMSVLFGHMLQEYVKSANALGYELGAGEVRTETRDEL